ncbi:hypothetical protein HMPREF9450_01938 [Alistipes indistinctus YIT 12060]|uniref:Peptidase M12A domain-containing protein n=2 Tax=Alistipes indistinctus TaxID=626932 RepID=G5HBC3_9BACT|nr:hypothetical protein HMPREF9450_01938 [Alistipes indistinctus YIT 12060]
MLLLASCIMGCAKEKEGQDLKSPEIQRLEEYRPGVPRESFVNTKGAVIEKIDSVYVIEGDILLSQKQAEEFGAVDTKGAYLNDYRWPDGIVYFCWPNFVNPQGGIVSTNTFTQTDKIYAAMNYYHKLTGVQFRLCTKVSLGRVGQGILEQNRIELIDGEGSYSALGCQGGVQTLCLDPSWATVGTAIHELGHAIGLLHEQCRWDRDNYIDIIYNNIQGNKQHNFDKSSKKHQVSSNFDFNSVMLYGSYNSFAVDESKPTMKKKNGSTWNAQRSYLSESDLAAIRQMYPFQPCNVVLQKDTSSHSYRRQ